MTGLMLTSKANVLCVVMPFSTVLLVHLKLTVLLVYQATLIKRIILVALSVEIV